MKIQNLVMNDKSQNREPYGQEEGVCLQRQSSTEKSPNNILPNKFLSVFKFNQFTTQYQKPLKNLPH